MIEDDCTGPRLPMLRIFCRSSNRPDDCEQFDEQPWKSSLLIENIITVFESLYNLLRRKLSAHLRLQKEFISK